MNCSVQTFTIKSVFVNLLVLIAICFFSIINRSDVIHLTTTEDFLNKNNYLLGDSSYMNFKLNWIFKLIYLIHINRKVWLKTLNLLGIDLRPNVKKTTWIEKVHIWNMANLTFNIFANEKTLWTKRLSDYPKMLTSCIHVTVFLYSKNTCSKQDKTCKLHAA